MKKKAIAKAECRVSGEEKDFSAIFNVIAERRARALMSVNVEMLLTNWEVGAFLSQRVHTGSWSTAVVGRLADYIKRNDPTLKGYGKSSLYNMALVYDTFSSGAFAAVCDKYSDKLAMYDNIFQTTFGKSSHEPDSVTHVASGGQCIGAAVSVVSREIFQPMVGKSIPKLLFLLSYTKLLLIAAHCSDAQEALFYIVYSLRERLTHKQLGQTLAANTYATLLGSKRENYSAKLKKLYPSAPLIIKDTAFLDYLSLPEKHREKKLRREIVAHIKDFILEMGKDFLFMDQEYTLPVGGEEFHSDLLFYHRGLQCLVAFELKTRKFKPQDLGQLEFYLEALDRDVKKENENPSIGIVLCKQANKVVVEYALSRTMSPVMVAQYKKLLIPKKVLERTFEEYLALPQNLSLMDDSKSPKQRLLEQKGDAL